MCPLSPSRRVHAADRTAQPESVGSTLVRFEMTQPAVGASLLIGSTGGGVPVRPGHGASRERAREMWWVFAVARGRGRDRAGDWDDRGGETNPRRPRRGPRPNNSLPRSRIYTNPAPPATGVCGREQKLEQRWDRGIGSGTRPRGGLDQRIPVSMEKSTRVKRPGRTRACSGWSPRPMGGCAVRETA